MADESINDVLMPCKLAAAVCYDSKPSSVVVKSCYKSGHGSVLEHISFTFHIEGISRSCSHQLVRHRLASFDQRSQRYCNENNTECVVPRKIANDVSNLERFNEAIDNIWTNYNCMVNNGIPKEDAREILPNACETEMYMTMNLRELSHFMGLRLCTRAQEQIRTLAKLMRDAVLEVCPEVEYMLVPKCEAIPGMAFCTEHQSCGRHETLKAIMERAGETNG